MRTSIEKTVGSEKMHFSRSFQISKEIASPTLKESKDGDYLDNQRHQVFEKYTIRQEIAYNAYPENFKALGPLEVC